MMSFLQTVFNMPKINDMFTLSPFLATVYNSCNGFVLESSSIIAAQQAAPYLNLNQTSFP